jgi:hypothetical protein
MPPHVEAAILLGGGSVPKIAAGRSAGTANLALPKTVERQPTYAPAPEPLLATSLRSSNQFSCQALNIVSHPQRLRCKSLILILFRCFSPKCGYSRIRTWEVHPKTAKEARRARFVNVLDNEVELLFLDHDHLPALARTLRVDRRTILSNPTMYKLVSDAGSWSASTT